MLKRDGGRPAQPCSARLDAPGNPVLADRRGNPQRVPHDEEVAVVLRVDQPVRGNRQRRVGGPEGEVQRRQIEAFILAFPTNLAPIVGQQITLTRSSSAAVTARLDLLRQRADAGECDLVAKTTLSGAEAGFLYIGAGAFRPDRRAQPPIGGAALRLLATSDGRPVTFTCVPPGSGERIAVDRDGDGSWDGDERDAHTDPADPTSTP